MSSEAADPLRQGLIAALEAAILHLSGLKGVDDAVIVSRDGLLVAASPGRQAKAEVQAAVTAAMFAAIDRTATSTDLGTARAALVETSDRSIQILSLAELLLVVIAHKSANIASIRAGMARVAGQIVRQAAAN